ncbi:hypothetical protein M0802_004076 [Mischocyttarus mexicanus]|nr:hypothetical protein M0802_004076 [Mischocyttarus mexicanus]
MMGITWRSRPGKPISRRLHASRPEKNLYRTLTLDFLLQRVGRDVLYLIGRRIPQDSQVPPRRDGSRKSR